MMIRTNNLSHLYTNTDWILKDISLDINPGEKVVLLGANGTGKSTLLKILNGLIHPKVGRYWYKGEEVLPKTLKSRAFNRRFRKEVVFLFQNPDAMIFNPTVYDEIAFGLRQLHIRGIDDRVRHWAEILGVSRYLQQLPLTLSSGEKQRVCLASLLVLEPNVLLLDEPTSNLDPRSTGWLVDFLQDLDVTTVITTHNLSLAVELGGRALVLSEKHDLIYDGPMEALMENEDKLIEANLLHTHRHKHPGLEHRHYHSHSWD